MVGLMSFETWQRRWRWLAALDGLLLLHLLYYLGLPDRGNSASFLMLAAAVALLALGGIAFALWQTPARLERARGWMRRWQALYIAGAGALLVVFGLLIRLEWLYAHIALAASATFALGWWTLYGGQPLSIPTRAGWIALGVVVVVVVALRIYSLSYYPPLHVDEPWTLSWAVNYVRTGQVSDRIMLNFNGDPRYDIPRYYLALGIWLQVVGIGLWEGRLFAFLLMMVVVIFGGLAAKNLYGPRAGWFAAAALFSSNILMLGARIRHDIGLAVAVALSLWLFTKAFRSGLARYHFLAGLAMGWGAFAHYNAVFLGMALTAGLYLPEYAAGLRSGRYAPSRGFWLYVAGGALAAFTVALVQIFPDVESFSTNRAARTATSLSIFLNTTWFYIASIFRLSHIEFLFIGAAVVAAVLRRARADWMLVLTLIMGHLALGAGLTVAPDEYYILPLTPFYGVLIGSLLARGSAGHEARLLSLPAALMAGFFLLPMLAATLTEPVNTLLDGRPLRLPPPAEAQWVREHLEPGRTVMGVNYFYLWLTDYRYASPHIPYRMLPGKRAEYPTDTDLWDAVGIDVFIDAPRLHPNELIAAIRESGYFESRGYRAVAQLGSGSAASTIYQRP